MGREAAVMDWDQKFPFLREKGHVVSLIGGGGKTTLLYALSAYCTAKGWRVLTATTTHIRKPVNVPWIAVNEKIPRGRMPEKSEIVSGSREPMS